MAKATNSTNVWVHAFTDGSGDCDPKSGLGLYRTVGRSHETILQASFATIVGRYYAMDRDNRWERIQIALRCHGERTWNTVFKCCKSFTESSYEEEITDEFIKPLVTSSGDGMIQGWRYRYLSQFQNRSPERNQSGLNATCFPEYGMKPCALIIGQ